MEGILEKIKNFFLGKTDEAEEKTEEVTAEAAETVEEVKEEAAEAAEAVEEKAEEAAAAAACASRTASTVASSWRPRRESSTRCPQTSRNTACTSPPVT